MFLWHQCHPGVIVFLLCFGMSLQNFDQQLFTSFCWIRLLSYGSVSICGIGKSGFVSAGRTFLASLYTNSMNSSNLCHTAQNGRVVRRGYNRHLHGQRLVPPEGA